MAFERRRATKWDGRVPSIGRQAGARAHRGIGLLLACAAASLLLHCGGGSSSETGAADGGGTGTTLCVPGMSITCAGPGACSGYQVCDQAGSGFGPCDCTVSTGPDAGQPEDASTASDGGGDGAAASTNSDAMAPDSDAAGLDSGADVATDSAVDEGVYDSTAEGTSDATIADGGVSESGTTDSTAGSLDDGETGPPAGDAEVDATIPADAASAEAAADAATDRTPPDASFADVSAPVCPLLCGPDLKFVGGQHSATLGGGPSWCLSLSSTDTSCAAPNVEAPCDFPHAIAATACVAGACAIASCESGWADCNGDPADGCEADLSSPQTCNGCSTACAVGELCTPAGCAASCKSPLTQCTDRCVDLTASPYNCGACAASTNASHAFPTCANGVSGSTCKQGFRLCSGSCVDTNVDVNNSGACGSKCPSNPTGCTFPLTANGVCYNCSPGDTPCADGRCHELKYDASDCGACGHACASTESCISGTCVATSSIWLATGLSAPGDITLDSTSVYWTDNGSIEKVAKTGGVVSTLATGQSPNRITLDASYVYWSNGGTVVRVPKDGSGSPQTVASATTANAGIAVVGPNVYWTDDGNQTVQVAPIAGGTPSQFFSMGPGASTPELITDGTKLYASDLAQGTIIIDIASAKQVGSATGRYAYIQDGSLYTADAFGIYSGGGILFLNTQAASGCYPTVFGMVADPCTGIYSSDGLWAVRWGSNYAINIPYTANRMTLDQTSLYWTGSSGIGKIPIPR